MIVEVPFAYSATVVPPRCRNPVAQWVLDRLPVKLRVETAESMPVAFRVAHQDAEHEVRFDGKRLWRATDDLDLAAAQAALDGFRGTPFAPLQDPRPHWVRENERAGRGDARWRLVRPGEITGHLTADDRRERVATILKLARELVFLDGRVFRRCHEPAWLAIPSAREPLISAVFADDHELSINGTELFRADDQEGAIEAATGREDCAVRGGIEILMPEAIRGRLADSALAIAASKWIVKDQAARTHILDASTERVLAWLKVRDTLEACGNVADDALAAAIDEHLSLTPVDDLSHARTMLERAVAHRRREREKFPYPEETAMPANRMTP